jgi:hypothetical protein
MEAEQALKQYAAGRRDFSWIDLSTANLKHSNLSGATLYQATLSGANLAGANLSKASLSNATLVAANLKGSNLTNARLSKTNLSEAQLQEADLTGANFKGANLQNANLSGANLSQTQLSGANLAGAVLLETNIEAADLTDAILTGAIMPDGKTYELWKTLHSLPTAASPASKGTKADVKPSATSKYPPRGKAYSQNNTYRQRPILTERRPLTNEEFWERLPLPSLFLLFLGYLFFGLLLSAKTSFWVFWTLAWAGTVSWVFHPSLTWLIPISGAVAVLLAVVSSLPSQGLMILIVSVAALTLLFLTALKFFGVGVLSNAKDMLWLMGLVVVAFLLGAWLFWGGPITWPLALGLLLAMATAGLGSIAWFEMEADGFSEKQIFWIFGSMTALGLVVAWLMGSLFF